MKFIYVQVQRGGQRINVNIQSQLAGKLIQQSLRRTVQHKGTVNNYINAEKHIQGPYFKGGQGG